MDTLVLNTDHQDVVREGAITQYAWKTAPDQRAFGMPGQAGITIVDDFLSRDEYSAALEELNFTVWRPSMTYMEQPDGSRKDILSPLRKSETAQQSLFSDELVALIATIEQRLQTIFSFDRTHLEFWQGTDYPRGGTFYYHMDAGYWDDHYAGDRIITFLIYLTTPKSGGGTHFRALDERVQAKAGRLLMWNNLFDNGDANYGMMHSGVPLRNGKKTTLVTWLRQKQFRHQP